MYLISMNYFELGSKCIKYAVNLIELKPHMKIKSKYFINFQLYVLIILHYFISNYYYFIYWLIKYMYWLIK